MTKTQSLVFNILLFLSSALLVVSVCVNLGDLMFAQLFCAFLVALLFAFIHMCHIELAGEQLNTDRFLAKVHKLDKETFLNSQEILKASLVAIHKGLPTKKKISVIVLIWVCILATAIIVYKGIVLGVWVAIIPYIFAAAVAIVILALHIAKLAKESNCFKTALKLPEKVFGTAQISSTITTVEVVNISGEFVRNFSVTGTIDKPVIYEASNDCIKLELIEILALICDSAYGQIYFNGINAKQIKEEDKFNKVCLIDSQNLEFQFDGDNNISFYGKYTQESIYRARAEVKDAISKGFIKNIDEISLSRAVLKDADVYVIDGDCGLDKKDAEAQLNAILKLLPDKIVFVVKRK